MARRGRTNSDTGFYHVMVRGINHELIFEQIREKNYFKKILKKHLEQYNIEIHAYCIMSNHAHFILKSMDINIISFYMSKVLAEYANYYNYKRNRNGHVFQNRFKSECISDANYYWNCVKYIHMNPVKAHIVATAEEYQYSSYKEFKNRKSKVLHANAFKMYEERFIGWQEYVEFHQKQSMQVFIGMQQEVYLQQKDFAWQILLEMKEKYSMAHLEEVLEEKDIRKEFMQRMSEEIQLSVSKMKRIYKEIKQELFES